MRESILEILALFAMNYGGNLEDVPKALWEAVLHDLTDEEIKEGGIRYLRSGNPFFPKPGQIYEIIRPQSNLEDEASVVVDKIFSEIAKCDYNTERGCEKTLRSVDAIGQEFFRLNGGVFAYIKSFKTGDSLSVAKGQARRTVEGLLRKNLKDKQIGISGGNYNQLTDRLDLKLNVMPGSDIACEK